VSKGSEFIGLPVINKKDGNRIALIKDIIYSKKKFRVLAFLVNERTFFKDAKVIKFKNIDAFGKDALMVKNKLVIEEAGSIPEIEKYLKDKNKVIDEEVLTEDGESLGLIQDTIIEEDKGKILGFILTDGIIEDIKEGRNVLPYIKGISFGEDKLIISNNIKEQFDKNKKDFKKLLGLL